MTGRDALCVFLHLWLLSGFTAASLTNVALSGTAFQSTVMGSAFPSRAIDGNRNPDFFAGSCTHTMPGATTHWWSVLLPAVYNVFYVNITNRNELANRLNNAMILVGNSLENNGNNNPSCAVINSIPAAATANFYCSGMTGRLVNVFLQTTDPSCVLTLCEVEVYGELAAPSPSFTASVMGRNIAVVENKLSWPDALFYCRNFYWDLLSIRTEEDQRQVEEVLAMTSFPLTNDVWVGLRRYLNDGTWFWMAGQSVTYSNWKTTLVWQYTKQCGAMDTSGGFFWGDLPCDEPLHFICLTDNDLTQLSVDFFSTIRPTEPQPSTWKNSALAQYT